MTETSLILIDGPGGSGKSSIAQHLQRRLEAEGRPARWYHEEEVNHPIHFWDEDGGIGGDVDTFLEGSLSRWRATVQDVKRNDETLILESSFLQCTAGLLLEEAVETGRIETHLRSIEKITKPLNPKLAYLRPSDPAQHFLKTCETRGPKWLDWYVDTHSGVRYLKENRLEGLSGFLEYKRAQVALYDRIVRDTELVSTVIEVDKPDWEAVYGSIEKFLGLAQDTRVEGGGNDPFVGIYSDERGQIEVYTKNGELVATNLLWPEMGLIPKAHKEFWVRSLPIWLRFEGSEDGQSRRIHIEGSGVYNLSGRTLERDPE